MNIVSHGTLEGPDEQLPDEHVVEEQSEDRVPSVPPCDNRRSRRQTLQPAWMRTGDYVME